MELTAKQKEILEQLKVFANDDQTNIFILKGYAGTGKTTMLKVFAEWLAEDEACVVRLMAPTGRAAKILKKKVGYSACTIHKCIYSGDLKVVESKEDDEVRFKYIYPIVGKQKPKDICVVDEASMVSSKKSRHELFSFGTDVLIDDLLTFANPHGGGKLVFVGDPAQLPPVGDNSSKALDRCFFEEKGLKVAEAELTEVLRQGEGSVILKNSMKIRHLLDSDERSTLSFEIDGEEMVELGQDDFFDVYMAHCPQPKVGDSVVVCYSNRTASDSNKAIRSRLFSDISVPNIGDIFISTHNSYHMNNREYDVMNGDLLTVLEVSKLTEKRMAPVYVSEKGEKNKVNIPLVFRKVTVQLEENGNCMEVFILESFLNDYRGQLTVEEQKALFIDFCIRNPNLKPGSEEFKTMIKVDPYYNCLKVKYGYAITCHKSQGGEWDSVFVKFRNQNLTDEVLRWTYTALTRGRHQVLGCDMPKFSAFDKIDFSNISVLTKKPKDFYPQKAIKEANEDELNLVSPYHTIEQKELTKKYMDVLEQLRSIGIFSCRVESKPFREMYFIKIGGADCRFDVMYNGKFQFKPFVSQSKTLEAKAVLDVLNAEIAEVQALPFQYSPSSPFLETLYKEVVEACVQAEAEITNVIEDLEHYKVVFYVKTADSFSNITFYFNKSGVVTKAIPQSSLGEKDASLTIIISILKNKLWN